VHCPPEWNRARVTAWVTQTYPGAIVHDAVRSHIPSCSRVQALLYMSGRTDTRVDCPVGWRCEDVKAFADRVGFVPWKVVFEACNPGNKDDADDLSSEVAVRVVFVEDDEELWAKLLNPADGISTGFQVRYWRELTFVSLCTSRCTFPLCLPRFRALMFL
jgi:hypothetical protein